MFSLIVNFFNVDNVLSLCRKAVGVVSLLRICLFDIVGDIPKGLTTYLKRWMCRCFVPENVVLQFVAFGRIVDHKALVVLRALIHHLTKHFECRKHACVVIVYAFSVRYNVLSQYENIVDVGSQIRRNTQRVLHRYDEEHLQMTTIHEQCSNVDIFCPGGVVQTVV